jgi:hypothetical protein
MWKQTNKFRAATNTWAWHWASKLLHVETDKTHLTELQQKKKKKQMRVNLWSLIMNVTAKLFFSLGGTLLDLMLWVFVVWPVYLTNEASTRRGGTKVLRECWTAVLSSRRTSPWRHGIAAFSWWSIWRQARTAFLGSGVPSPKEHAFSGSLRESFHAV